MSAKKILFVTGTRADYGKLKPLIQCVESCPELECYVFVSGMHLLETFGSTYMEVLKDGYSNVYVAHMLHNTDSMSANFADVVRVLSQYIAQSRPDMIVVHGDRIDALAGAVTGALNNILVSHIEGGEVSGTIDESIRHAISKFSHIHFVSNDHAKSRLVQLGEDPRNIFVIGSPDIDIMYSDVLPALEEVKAYYDIPFDQYAIFMFHPVTTEYTRLSSDMESILRALLESRHNYVVVYPNNDSGCQIILDAYKKEVEPNQHFRLFPSISFERFLTLLKNAKYMVGNSSAGIRETSVFGIPTIDIGSRQSGRYSIQKQKNIIHVNPEYDEIRSAIDRIEDFKTEGFSMFGNGNSVELFLNTLIDGKIWTNNLQKKFIDLKETL